MVAIDPGRSKCGVAVVRSRAGGAEPHALHMAVVDADELESALRDLAAGYTPDAVVVGDGTTSGAAIEAAERVGNAPVNVVDERSTTLLARKRYFSHHPPRGLRRLVPLSLQTPARPYDDFVALILAERYLASHTVGQRAAKKK